MARASDVPAPHMDAGGTLLRQTLRRRVRTATGGRCRTLYCMDGLQLVRAGSAHERSIRTISTDAVAKLGRASETAGLSVTEPAAQALFEDVVAIDELQRASDAPLRSPSLHAGRPRRRARFALAATAAAVVAVAAGSLSPRPCTMRHQRLPRSPSGTRAAISWPQS